MSVIFPSQNSATQFQTATSAGPQPQFVTWPCQRSSPGAPAPQRILTNFFLPNFLLRFQFLFLRNKHNRSANKNSTPKILSHTSRIFNLTLQISTFLARRLSPFVSLQGGSGCCVADLIPICSSRSATPFMH
ncbi:hypothetical protein SLE2022_271710 [Rubroshorea leprosula]